jgi:hypothetical protein
MLMVNLVPSHWRHPFRMDAHRTDSMATENGRVSIMTRQRTRPFPRTRQRWTLLAVPLLAAAMLASAGAEDEYTYPRLSLGTGQVDRWITVKDSSAFLARFQEIYTGSPAEKVLETKQRMRDLGYGEWADHVRFIQMVEPLCAMEAVPEADGKLPAWQYDYAKNNLTNLLTVALYHNLRDHGCDWLLHDAHGDTMCVWGSTCGKQLINISRWCPKGQWDGRVSKIVNGHVRTWDFGSTVGLNFVEWMCTVVRDSLYLHNEVFAQAYDGLQLEDSFGRDVTCLFAYNPHGYYHRIPDPRRDGIGLSCEWDPDPDYIEATRPQVDSVLTYFVQAVRDAGFITRGNGHYLRWLLDPQCHRGEDAVYTQTFSGWKVERYGDWGGWPNSDSTRGYWFRCYRSIEDVYRPHGVDSREGWDVTTLQSNPSLTWSDAKREKWARFNLGQCLMGDGFFDGQAFEEDFFFYKYLEESVPGWAAYAPTWIPEMGLTLGHAVDDFQEYRAVPDAKPLYYRHFTNEVGQQTFLYTVVVNIWPVTLAGVPARDAMWFNGHQTSFPRAKTLLVFNHWPDMHLPPAWSIVRVGNSGLDMTIRFDLPESRDVALCVYDLNGRRVRTLVEGQVERGPFEVTWRGDDDRGRRVGAGLYFWNLSAGDVRGRGRLLLLH